MGLGDNPGKLSPLRKRSPIPYVSHIDGSPSTPGTLGYWGYESKKRNTHEWRCILQRVTPSKKT